LRITTILLTAAVGLLIGCSGSPADQHLDIVFDVCAPIAVVAPDATLEQRAGIERGVDLWRDRGVTTLSLDAAIDAPSVEIQFDDAAANFHGIYEDEIGVIFVNRDLTDLDALGVTVAHELGHAFGLWHVDVAERLSVMNPGNLSITPTDGDQLALTEVWGSCSPAEATR